MMSDFGDEITLLSEKDVAKIATRVIQELKEDKELAKDLGWVRHKREEEEGRRGARRRILENILGGAGTAGVGLLVILFVERLIEFATNMWTRLQG